MGGPDPTRSQYQVLDGSPNDRSGEGARGWAEGWWPEVSVLRAGSCLLPDLLSFAEVENRAREAVWGSKMFSLHL